MIQDTFTTVYVVLDVLLALIVIGGNILVSSVILNSASLRKKAMYIFVTSLAFADTCVGLTAIPFGILTKLGIPYNSPILCITMLSFIIISTQISIFNMMAIAVERYLAIRHPRVHYTKLTPKRSLYIIVLTWLSAILVGCLPLLGWNKLNNFSFEVDHLYEGQYISNEVDHKPHENNPTKQNASNHHQRVTSHNLTSFNFTLNVTFPPDDPSLPHHVHCKFLEMMDENYMFFNFTVCVLPSLITCAVIYFIIFLSLIRAKQPSDKLHDQQKNGNKFNSRTPMMLHRKKEQNYSPQMILHRTRHPNTKNKIKIVLDLPSEDSVERRVMSQPRNYKEINTNIKQLNLSPRFLHHSAENSHLPLLTPGVSKEMESTSQTHLSLAKSLDPDVLYNQLSKFSVDDLQKPNYCQAFKLKFGHSLLSNGVSTSRSSYASAPTLTRSCSSHLNWDEVRRKKHHHHRCKEVHAATVLGLIVLSFVICWMPIHILNTINKFDVDDTIEMPSWLFDVGVLLSHTNSAVNFFLYSWRLKAFRKQLHLMTFRKISRS